MITITDEQIREIFNSHKVNLSTPDINPAIYDAARDLIALAQEVRPLEWVDNYAKTPFGQYEIDFYDDEHSAGFFFKTELFEDDFLHQTEEEAQKAAQADFNRRVLANLVHGGNE